MSQPDHSKKARRQSARDRLRVVARQEAASAPAPDATDSADSSEDSLDDRDVVEQLAAPADSKPRRTPRIAPHAARTANRARRTWISLLFFPVFFVYVIVDLVRSIADRVARARNLHLESRPPFRRPDAMPSVAERTMADAVRAVESMPYRPLRLSTSAAFFRDNGPDALAALLSPNPQAATIPHMYPRTFTQRLFTGHDGVRLSGMEAMHEHRGPAIVIAHGLLMTKNFDLIIQMAKRAYEQWGFHVVTLDLRGWGQSAWTTDAPASAGYFEGRDIVEVCRELREDPRVTSVAGIGFSLGGASMLNAAHVSSTSEDRPLDGGVVAVSPPTMIDDAIRHISTKPHWRDPFWGLWHVFDAAIKANVRRHGLPGDTRTWLDLVERLSVPYYDVPFEEFTSRASAVNFAHEIDVPTLVLHAADDFVVQVQNAYGLADAAADNEHVHVIVRDAGAHVSFAAVDTSWYHSALRCWFEYWATPGSHESADPEDLEATIAG